MSKVYLNSFSTPDFHPYLKDMVKSARKFGVKKCLCYGVKDLYRTSFYRKNEEIFRHKKGFGFWLWKPFFVNEAMKELKDGDILFYVDAASLFIADPAPLIELARTNESGVVAFDGWPLTNGQWTKRDAFVNTGCDTPEFWNANKVIATVFLFRKNEFTTRFCKEWLEVCTNFGSISDAPNAQGLPDVEGFVAHRMDQSMLAILTKKYNIETYRNPSKWGNFLKLPEYRVPGEHLTLSYLYEPAISDYDPSPYQNSRYGTLFDFNRRVNHPKQTKRFASLTGPVTKVKSAIRKLRNYLKDRSTVDNSG